MIERIAILGTGLLGTSVGLALRAAGFDGTITGWNRSPEQAQLALKAGAIDTVATIGICEVFPGAVNSIPARVRLSVDIRDTDLQRRDAVIRRLEESCESTSAKRQVQIHIELLNADAPAESGATVVTALSEACRKHGFDFLTMTSRAYHDSLFMSQIAPVAMLFIPCRNGYSHRPDEYSSPEDIARGALILAETLATLAA